MEYIIITVIFLITMIILKFAFNIKISDISELKKIGFDKQLNKITDKFSDNKNIAKDILNQIQNNHTKIEEDENGKENLYIVVTDKIIIANVKDTFTRIQTVAHECIHSIQDKRILMFNFIYTNLYNIFFILLVILKIFNIIKNPMSWCLGLILAGFVYYVVRAYLENDAMARAKYVARDYMKTKVKNEDLNRNVKSISKREIDQVVNGYTQLNEIGMKLYNYKLLIEVFIRNIIFSIICIFR